MDSSSDALCVMTMNLQYFASFPNDEEQARKRLEEVLYGPGEAKPDVICVQEGIASKDVLGDLGFKLKICAGSRGVAQSVYDMVYGDAPALKTCPKGMEQELLCNQIYLRKDSPWKVLDSGVLQISSNMQLVGGGGRPEGNLAIRSMVWLKLAKLRRGDLPSVYVMCAHISGGRFEDQYFVQQLAEERFLQLDRILTFFRNSRPNPEADDIGICIGDFNATTEYKANGPMSGYFKAGIADSAGVKADADAAASKGKPVVLEEQFKKYMLSPFEAINKHEWLMCYGPELGVTSGFGHLIDHMAMNRKMTTKSTVQYLTNQKFGGKPPDTNLPLTDHNSVKTVFNVSDASKEQFGTTADYQDYRERFRCASLVKQVFQRTLDPMKTGKLSKMQFTDLLKLLLPQTATSELEGFISIQKSDADGFVPYGDFIDALFGVGERLLQDSRTEPIKLGKN